AALVVVGGVGGEAGDLGRDQGGAVAGASALDGGLERVVAGQQVAAVDADADHAVALRALGDAVHAHLQPVRHRDRVVVVLHDAEEGQPVDAGPVEALVPVALGGPALADAGDR